MFSPARPTAWTAGSTGGKLYIRIVDYKSGKKKFALSDVWQGMGLQMLLYLFTLEKHGAERYGKEIVPAGVLYVPAHDILVRADKRLSDEEIVAEKARKLHRSGLILSETEVVEAMEHGEALQFLPLYRGKLAAEALATAEPARQALAVSRGDALEHGRRAPRRQHRRRPVV